VGDTLAAIALEDPHSQPGAVDAATRAVLSSRNMDGGALVREALATDGVQLERAGAVYIADVHAMHGMIRRIFAIPMDGAPTAALRSVEGKATWRRLEGLRVLEIRFLGSSEEVRAALGTPAGDWRRNARPEVNPSGSCWRPTAYG
jgi:hypothetical protein